MARYFVIEFDIHEILLNFYRNFILNFDIQYNFSKQFVNHIWSRIELNAGDYILYHFYREMKKRG